MSVNDDIDDGGVAFPGPCQHETDIDINEGMSLRDWFAGQALAGVWAGRESDFVKISAPTTTDVAVACYAIADAMIQARSGHGRPSGEA